MTKYMRTEWLGDRHIRGKGKIYTGFWWENLKESRHLEDLNANGRSVKKELKKKLGWCELE
jgi:hypothetical protein